MAAINLLNPPSLSDEDNIDSWLHTLQIWKCLTELDKKQQVHVIYLLLPDKIRNSCRDICNVENLNQKDGLKLLIDKLKKFHVKHSEASACLA